MIKIKITWPLLIVLLIALIAYLARDPGHKPTRRSPDRRPRRPAPPRSAPEPFVIDQDGPARDYDAETDRLDREAAEAGRRAYDNTSTEYEIAKERMNERHKHRNARG